MRGRSAWTIVLGACALLASGRAAVAQASAKASSQKAVKPATRPATPSTLSGVYTAEQADRGRDVYVNSCKSCHTPVSHTGATFQSWWAGRTVADLFVYVAERMPKNDPGSLSPEEAADVVAYLFRMNGLPAGKKELPADGTELGKIRILTSTRGTKRP
ncbi:MAG TPA: cytochrome c [Gemmatimonadaceae bacterium]|nr:cytochrome c [Gemmatimonadaceae bacterium]